MLWKLVLEVLQVLTEVLSQLLQSLLLLQLLISLEERLLLAPSVPYYYDNSVLALL